MNQERETAALLAELQAIRSLLEQQNRESQQLTYTVPEAAEAVGISRNNAYQLVHRADFPSVRIGGRWVVPKDSLRRWLECQAEEKAPCAHPAKSTAQRTETPQTTKEGLRLV